MMFEHFAHLEMLCLALVVIPLALWRRARTRVSHSNAKSIQATAWTHWLLSLLPGTLLGAAIILGAVALARPQKVSESPVSSTMVPGRDIMIALDYSYSMAQPFEGTIPETKSRDNFDWSDPDDEKEKEADESQKPRRIDAAVASVLAFVDTRLEGKRNDAIGLIAFDRKPILRWKLDRDLKQIIRHGNFLPKGKAPGGFGEGTNFGTTGPGPIDLAASHFAKAGRSRSKVIIIVSDGEDKLSGEANQRLTKILNDAGIKLYVIGVGLSTKSADIIQFAESRGGKESVFRVENAGDLQKCFQKIDEQESSPVPLETVRKHDELFVLPLALALIFVLSWALLEALLFGR